ncbi:hypothetical protein SerAS12_2789 [Serratia sp. AS12]|uniref:hypothetical protein n=1 Tax=Serratia TaxID=613 RepID=UPI00020E99E1|nr:MULTISPECIES: hypothetical protein [Serratia]AEF45908.1 hypothetical protein SerAS9_2788 [Serratia plymuthica AS9]AEF50859.1 hypothetical protein SerAS12_2789 [Serratia sp. AS12]AEG28566.1 hypothetical protein SerAS13_2790 [Serratia sp. AS13]UTN94657.1 hypothetical protein NLX81_14210 [Serratia plymuthica]
MKGLLASLILISSVASAGTLSDFFANHPDLDANLPVHTAISKASRFEAAGFARREGGDEKELMNTKGDQFAILGFRRVKMSCSYPESAQMSGLSDDDCKLVLSKKI